MGCRSRARTDFGRSARSTESRRYRIGCYLALQRARQVDSRSKLVFDLEEAALRRGDHLVGSQVLDEVALEAAPDDPGVHPRSGGPGDVRRDPRGRRHCQLGPAMSRVLPPRSRTIVNAQRDSRDRLRPGRLLRLGRLAVRHCRRPRAPERAPPLCLSTRPTFEHQRWQQRTGQGRRRKSIHDG